jgi:hypothetical protein
MKPKVVYIFMGIVILGLVITNILFYFQNDDLIGKMISFKQITETLVRSQTEIVSKKDLDKALKKYLTNKDITILKEDLRKMNATLGSVGITIGKLERKVKYNQRSDKQGKPKEPVVICKEDGRPIDVHGYTKTSQIKKIRDKNNADLADITFDASSKTPWSYEVFLRKFYLSTIVGKKKDGSDIYYHSLKYKVPNKHKEKLFNIPITSSSYKQRINDRQMFWWNPTIDLSVSFGGIIYSTVFPEDLLSVGVDLGFSTSSYGRTKADSLWKFFRFGIGYDAVQKSAFLSIAPISYNLGDPLPLLTNLYLTPKIHIDYKGNIALGLGIGVQF